MKLINDVIESDIDGEFTVWEGSRKYKLTNGQFSQKLEYNTSTHMLIVLK